MNRRSDLVQSVGLFALAAIVIGFIGVFALVYHDSPDGTLALGALLPLAGMIGAHFYQSSQQGFLGGMLQGQRTDLLGLTSTPTTLTSSSTSAARESSAKPPATSASAPSTPIPFTGGSSLGTPPSPPPQP